MTAEEVAAYAYRAGFRGDNLTTAVAVAQAESGLNPKALNDNPSTGDYSVGLWQVNYIGDMYQPRSQKYGTPEQLLSDPSRQAVAAYDISGQGTNFTPWTTYTSGKYLAYLDSAQQAVSSFMGGGTAPGAVGSPNMQLISSSKPENGLAGGDHYIINLDTGVPGIPAIHMKYSTGRKIEGGAILVAGSIVSLVGVALLLGKSAASYVPNIAGVSQAISQRRLERTIDKGSRVPSPSRKSFDKAKAGKRVNPTTVDENGEPF